MMETTRCLQDRGLILLLGIAVLASGCLVFSDLRIADRPQSPAPILLQNVAILTPQFVPMEPLDVNSASADALTTLPGIGPALAQRIVAYREEHGPFESIRALEHVRGIGPQTVLDLSDAAVALPTSADAERQ